MRPPKPLKVEFVDKSTMKRVDELWNIVVQFNDETSELTAWLINSNPELDKQLEIRVKDE